MDLINVGPDSTHVALVSYSDEAELVFNFNTLRGSDITAENYSSYIERVIHQQGYTFIDKGLRLAIQKVFTPEAGMRANVAKVSVCDTAEIRFSGHVAALVRSRWIG